MSWTKEITTWCDHDDCAPEWLMSDAVGGNTVAATRRRARRLGWVHRDGKDFCPEHSDGGSET